jgi:hypothetical protein
MTNISDGPDSPYTHIYTIYAEAGGNLPQSILSELQSLGIAPDLAGEPLRRRLVVHATGGQADTFREQNPGFVAKLYDMGGDWPD